MALATQNPRTKRFVARLTAEDKGLLERAAAAEGQSMAQFVILYARQAAERVLRQRQKIVLNEEQSRRFVKAILTSSKPSNELKKAFKLYRKTVHER